ncbi:MAG: protein kinase [Akkermansiaceae bacterium]
MTPALDDDLPVLDDEPEFLDDSDEGRYSNEEKMGEGGTSIVYLANDIRLRRKVALKRFKQISRSNNEEEYLNELERTSSISHPYVVSAFDADVDRKGRFIAMEYTNGSSL